VFLEGCGSGFGIRVGGRDSDSLLGFAPVSNGEAGDDVVLFVLGAGGSVSDLGGLVEAWSERRKAGSVTRRGDTYGCHGYVYIECDRGNRWQ
jgi:hypothetical protein